MKKLLLLVLVCIPALCHAKVHTLQVTVGASATAFVSGDIICKWMVIQNNSTHTMRVGDAAASSTRGIQLLAGGSFTMQLWNQPGQNLNGWYVSGTNGDVLDIIYDDGAAS